MDHLAEWLELEEGIYLSEYDSTVIDIIILIMIVMIVMIVFIVVIVMIVVAMN